MGFFTGDVRVDSVVFSLNDVLRLSIFPFLIFHSLELIGTTAGVLGLILLAQEKRVGWLVGMIWSAISAYLAFLAGACFLMPSCIWYIYRFNFIVGNRGIASLSKTVPRGWYPPGCRAGRS